MSRRTLTSNAFHSAAATLNAAVAERRALRLTPPAPPPPRDSDPQAGEALPSHTAGDSDRPATLPPGSAPWAWSGSEGDSDDGTRG
jgi:hypothetical protein